MRGIVVVVAWLAASGGLAGQGTTDRPADAARLVADLGSPEFAVRERAADDLWKLGDAAKPALTAALTSDDAEVARRARLVLDKFAAGHYADTPPEVLKLQREFRSGVPGKQLTAFQGLVKIGPKALPTLRALLSTPLAGENPAGLKVALSRDLAAAVPGLILAGRADFAEDALALNALIPTHAGLNDYATFLRLRDHLPAAVARLEAADTSTPHAADAARRSLVFAYRAAGRNADALRLARQIEAADPAYRTVHDALLEATGDWATLAARSPADANSRGGLTAFRLRQAGKIAAADDVLVQEGESSDRLTGLTGAVDSPTLALFANDRSADALDRLKAQRNAPQILADVLAAQLKFREASDLLNERSRKLDDEAGIDVAALKPLYGARRGRILAQLGERDAATQVFEQTHAQVMLLPNSSEIAVTQLVRAEVRGGRYDLACEHFGAWLGAPDRQDRAPRSGQDPFELIFDADAESATFLWGVLRPSGREERGGTPGAAMLNVRRLLQGRATPDAVADALKAARRELLPLHAPQAAAQALAIAAVLRAADQPDEAIAELARRADRLVTDPLAADAEATFGGRGPGSSARGWVFGTDESYRFWVELGDLLTEQGKHKDAAERLLQGAAFYPGNPILLDLAGRARVKAGDATGGKKLVEAAHAVPLGNARLRGKYLEELLNRGHAADAARECATIRDCGWLSEDFMGNVWNQVARAASAARDYPTAAVANRKAIHYLLRTPRISYVEGTAYLTVPQAVRYYEAQARLAAGGPRDLDAGVALLKESLDVLPGGTDQLITAVTTLDKAGRTADATALFRRAFDAYRQVLADSPESAWARHSAAWLASGCGREPDLALTYAREAVAAEPQMRGYREGLAEAHFRRGDRDAATALMGKLVAEDRRSAHYKRQLARYKTGDLASPLPENDD